MGPTRLDSQIFACVCAGIKPNRDTVALHEIFLVTVCGLYFVPMFIRGDRTNSHPCWYRIYNCLSDNIEYAKLYVHLLRACRKTPLRVMGCLLASPLPLSRSCLYDSVGSDAFSLYLWVRTTSRMNLFKLNERTDRGPAISSVCHRRSLGLLNPYLAVFRVPMIPSVLPRSLRTVSRMASATCHAPWPLGWMPMAWTPSLASALTVAVA